MGLIQILTGGDCDEPTSQRAPHRKRRRSMTELPDAVEQNPTPEPTPPEPSPSPTPTPETPPVDPANNT